MGVVIENPGILTTIQDEGRYGYEQFGVSPAGPMDLESFHIANLLVGNDRGESALEATMLGPTLRFTRGNVIAVTGADMSPLLNEVPCAMNQAMAVRAGDVLKLCAAKSGCRTYVAFSGGLDVPVVMGSRATGIQNRVGGFQGRKLAKDDAIPFRAPKEILDNMSRRKADHSIPEGREKVLRVILGPQEDFFTREGLQTFLSQPYAVTNDFDRMGCRLEGAVIGHRVDGNIISDGMVTGAIQVPTSGQPIIMLAERQTVGGYTKIATVISADLPVIGQSRPGDIIRFQAVELLQAHKIWRERQRRLDALEEQFRRQAAGAKRYYRITVNGKVYETSIEIAP